LAESQATSASLARGIEVELAAGQRTVLLFETNQYITEDAELSLLVERWP
jgi:hypothetical protein